MAKPTPFGRDQAERNFNELLSTLIEIGKFGIPETQHGARGEEKLFHCPLCLAAGDVIGQSRKHLRVARRESGGELPWVGCREHGDDWPAIRAALVASGVPSRFLAHASGASSDGPTPDYGSGIAHGSELPRAVFVDRPDGLGEREPVAPDLVADWAAALWSPVGKRYLAYLRQRGLSDDIIRDSQLGLGDFRWTVGKRKIKRITIPIFNGAGDCVNIRLKALPGKGSKVLPYPHPTLKTEDGLKYQTYGAPARLYGIDWILDGFATVDDAEQVDYLFVVGGELDRLALCDENLAAVSPTGGEDTLPRRQDCAIFYGKRVIVCFDCDAAGRKGALKFASAVLELGAADVRVIDLDPSRTDGYDIADFLNDPAIEYPIDKLLDRVGAAQVYTSADLPAAPIDVAPVTSDYGLATALAVRYGAELLYEPKSHTWLGWNGKNWAWNLGRDGAPAEQAVIEYCLEMQSAAMAAEDAETAGNYAKYLNDSRVRAAVNRMSALPDFRVNHDDLDKIGTGLLNVANGTFEFATQRFRGWRASDLLTRITRGRYIADGAVDGMHEWKRFLNDVLPDPDIRAYLQRLIGYCLLDGNPQRFFIVIMGETSTGKSAFGEIVMHAMGTYADTINLSLFREKQDEAPRPDIVDILTSRIGFASETSQDWHLHADAVKRLTGVDTLKARLPHVGQYVSRIPAFTPIIRTNAVPTIRAADAALYRRLRVIPFDVEQKEEFGFVERMCTIVPDAVVTWAIRGLRAYLDDPGCLAPAATPSAILASGIRFRDETSAYAMFIKEVCDVDPTNSILNKDLFQAYRVWAEEADIREQPSIIEFGRRMSALGYPTKVKKVDGKTKRIFLGVAMKGHGRIR